MKRSYLAGCLPVLLMAAGCTSTAPALVVDNLEFPKLQAQVKSASALNPTQCLWKGQNEAVSLSWESVATFHLSEPDYDVSTNRVSACTLADPSSGEPLRVDGKIYVMPPWRTMWPAFLRNCYIIEGNPGNSYNECRPKAESCAKIEPACAVEGRHSNFPYCQNACTVNDPHDTTYRIELSQDGLPVPPASFQPTMYTIDDGRVLARRLRLDSTLSRPDEGLYRLRWNVESQNGIWTENFTPNLILSKVRAFVPGTRIVDGVYYENRSYLVLGDLQDGNSRLNPCERNPQDPTEITLDSCPALSVHNPATTTRASSGPVLWDLEIREAPNANLIRFPLTESQEVYLEFTMLNPSDNHAAPTLARTSRDVRAVRLGDALDLRKALLLDTGFSTDTWTIESVDLGGANAGEFSNLRAEGRSMPPFSLRGGSIPLSVTATPSRRGLREVNVRVSLRGQQAGLLIKEEPVSVFAYVPATLTATPDSLVVPFKPDRPSGVKKIELQNAGDLTLKRQAVRIAGPDARNFGVAGSHDLRTPVEETNELMPGQHETIYVYHRPDAAGTHAVDHAELLIESTAGSATVRLESSIP